MITRNLLAFAFALTAVAAYPATTPVRPERPRTAASPPPLQAFGSRGPAASAKLDGALADIVSHAARVRPGYELSDLRSLSPAARFARSSATEPPLVAIDAVTRGDPQQLKAALVALGLQHASVYSNDVGGWLPVSQLTAAALSAEVHAIRAAMPHTRAGAVTSQGDYVQRSDILRTGNSLDGTGVTVGILSDSFNCYQVYAADGVPALGSDGYAYNGFTADYPTDVSTGDLPAIVNVLEEAGAMDPSKRGCMNYTEYLPAVLPYSDEGRAMLQIVHDVAPGASLAFYTADTSEADFANGIQALANAGARVEADDVGYFDEPFFQDGIIAQAINQVEGHQGVAYFSAAGNEGQNSYENTAPSFTGTSATGEKLLNFSTSGSSVVTSLPITIAPLIPGEYVGLVVEWDQPYVTGAQGSPGASSQIDLCVTGSGQDGIYDLNGNPVACTGRNAIGSDPVQFLIVGNPATTGANTAAENLTITIGLAGGTTPGRIKFVLEDDGAGSTINSFSTSSPTIQGHPGAAGAAAVGAAYYFSTPRCGATMAALEGYSSSGGDPILFDTSGNRLSTPVVRQKPDFVGPDGVNNTFLGFQLSSKTTPASPPTTASTQCQDVTASAPLGHYPSFFGTSAATPHAAAIAALMLQAHSTATPGQIYTALRSTALSMGGSTPDYNSGYGFIQADAAFAALGSSSSSSSSSSTASSGGGGGGRTSLSTLLMLSALLAWRLWELRQRRIGVKR